MNSYLRFQSLMESVLNLEVGDPSQLKGAIGTITGTLGVILQVTHLLSV